MKTKIRKTKTFHADSNWELEEKINKWLEFYLMEMKEFERKLEEKRQLKQLEISNKKKWWQIF